MILFGILMWVTSCQGHKFQVFDRFTLQCQNIQPTTVLCELCNFVINSKNHDHSSIKLIGMIIDYLRKVHV